MNIRVTTLGLHALWPLWLLFSVGSGAAAAQLDNLTWRHVSSEHIISRFSMNTLSFAIFTDVTAALPFLSERICCWSLDGEDDCLWIRPLADNNQPNYMRKMMLIHTPSAVRWWRANPLIIIVKMDTVHVFSPFLFSEMSIDPVLCFGRQSW